MARAPFLGLRGRKLNLVVMIVAAFEFILFGYDQGVMGGLLTLPSFTRVFPEICTTGACQAGRTSAQKLHRSTIQGVVISSYNLGALIGSILTMKFGDRLGRRKSIFVGCTLVTIGGVLQASAYGLAHFIVGRIICGVGTGINTSSVPIWQAETTKPHQRGPVIALETSLTIGGVMVSYWIDFGFSYTEPHSIAWRLPIALQVVPALLVMSMIFHMPESPRWLVLRDRVEEATQVISALYDLPSDDPLVADQLQAIIAVRHVDEKAGIRDMLVQGPLKNRTRTMLGVGAQVLAQLSGINIITYYAATIYENEIGLTPFVSRLLAAANGTEYFVASLFSVPLINYLNRRPVLIMVATGCSLTMVALAVVNSLGGRGPGIAAATFLFVFNTFFGLGWAQLEWLYPAESTPLAIRGPANALATGSHWIMNFLVVMITPISFNNISWRTYIIFAVFNACSAIIFWALYPETRNRSLEEVDLIFRQSKNLRDAVKVANTMQRHFDNKGNMVHRLAYEVEEEVVQVKDGNSELDHVEKAGLKP